MKQRPGIAQALINMPKIVFLDEPVSAPDPAGRKQVMDIIQSLAGKHTAFPSLGKYTPAGLSNLSMEWIAGTGKTSDALWGAVIAAVIAVGMLIASIRIFKRQEL